MMMRSGELDGSRLSFGQPAFVREGSLTGRSGEQDGVVRERARGRGRGSVATVLGAPLLMTDLPEGDALAILLAKHLPTHLRPRDRDLTGSWPTPPVVSRHEDDNVDPFLQEDAARVSENDVQHATRTNAWRKIATLARSRIEAYSTAATDADENAGDDVEIVLQWWTVRLYALARLQLFSMLGNELNAVWHILATTSLDTAASILETDAVPFTLRTLRAMEPRYCRKDVTGSLEQLVQLTSYSRTRLRQALSSRDAVALRQWRERVLQLTLSQGMLLCEAKDYSQAIDTLQDLATHLASTNRESSSEDDWLDNPTRVLLLLFLARVWFQAGSLLGADKLVNAAAAQLPSVAQQDRQALENELAIARGTLATMRCDFDAACTHFSSVSGAGAKQEVQASNNLALSTFYAGQLSTAMDNLEGLLARHPDTAVNAEPFLFNLTTLLELRSEDVLADKRRILAVLGQHATHSSGILTASGLKL